MEWGWSEVGDCFPVGCSGIAFVDVPAVAWVLLGELRHGLVAVCFCEYGCSGYVGVFSITFHNGVKWDCAVWFETISVNDYVLWLNCERIQCPVHCEEGSLKDVYLVNLLRCDHSHRPCDSSGFNNRAQLLALLFSEFLGVVEEWVVEVLRQNDSGSIYRSGEAASSGFVTTGFNESRGVAVEEWSC